MCVSGSGERERREEGNELRHASQSRSLGRWDGMSLTQRDFKMEITVTAAAEEAV